MLIKIVSGFDKSTIEKEVNNFCSDKKNCKIQLSTMPKHYAPYNEDLVYYTVLIIY